MHTRKLVPIHQTSTVTCSVWIVRNYIKSLVAHVYRIICSCLLQHASKGIPQGVSIRYVEHGNWRSGMYAYIHSRSASTF